MTPPENLCPVCGSKIVTWISAPTYLLWAQCSNPEYAKCSARDATGKGNTTKEAIADFMSKAKGKLK